jgi:hypothetical protein
MSKGVTGNGSRAQNSPISAAARFMRATLPRR